MRILQLITRRQRRGAEMFATELADALSARGHAVLVAGIYAPLGTPLAPEQAAWLDVSASRRPGLRPGSLASLLRIIADHRPDVIQANGSDTLKYSVLARLALRGRWPLVYRNISIASRWLRGPAHRAWNRWLIGRVDRVVAVSRASLDDFTSTYAIGADRLALIPQAARVPATIDAAGARAVLASLAGLPSGAPLLMHIGSFAPEKNHLWLLDAFRRLREGGAAAHLILIGDGPLRPVVESRACELGLERCTHLLGSRADAQELVAGADLLVLPSLVEGLPGVVLEAAAQGVPAVANDVGGVHEAIRHGQTGLLVPPGNVDAFVSAAELLLADDTYRRAMGIRARQMVAEEYNLDDTVERYEALYRELAGGGAGTSAGVSQRGATPV